MEIQEIQSPPTCKSSKAQKNSSDRFIPKRLSPHLYHLCDQPRSERVENVNRYANLLEENLLNNLPILRSCEVVRSGEKTSSFKKNRKLLKFRQDIEPVQLNFTEELPIEPVQAKERKIADKPFKKLSVPGLLDDFYLNLLDWSSTNLVGVGLGSSVFVWSGCSNKVVQVHHSSGDNPVCAVGFLPAGHQIGFSTYDSEVIVKDLNKDSIVSASVGEHAGRIGSLSFSGNYVASGGRDGKVVIHDLRQKVSCFRYQGHQQEICGLKWSPDGTMIASGGNDNKLLVWDVKRSTKLVRFQEHKAAVKAIGWNARYPGLLASGGGTADKTLRFFSTQTLSQLHHVDTGSQVCNLHFSRGGTELVTTHGYSLNQINVWKCGRNWDFGELTKKATLIGHSYRVLYLAGSPDGSSIVTGAGDESLQFWSVFQNQCTSSLSLNEMLLR